eukprot:12322700-Heterocapsa_arctica.AAC.1
MGPSTIPGRTMYGGTTHDRAQGFDMTTLSCVAIKLKAEALESKFEKAVAEHTGFPGFSSCECSLSSRPAVTLYYHYYDYDHYLRPYSYPYH